MKKLLAVYLLFLTPLIYAQDKIPHSADQKHSAHPAAGGAGFKANVQKVADEWKAGYQAKDADRVAALYADDAVWINPDGTFHGTSEIKGEVKKMLDRGDVINSLTTTRAVGPGDLGYDEWTYTSKATTHGYWVVTVKNKDGKWMIASDTDVEAPGAAGMPKEDKKAK